MDFQLIIYFDNLQFGQAFYGFFFSAEVALFGYLYAMVEEKQHYQKITGHARAATLSGKFFSSCVSQILAMIFGTPPFNTLVYMSIFGKYLSLFLKQNNILSINHASIYFNINLKK